MIKQRRETANLHALDTFVAGGVVAVIRDRQVASDIGSLRKN
jgi:hypothetical protein